MTPRTRYTSWSPEFSPPPSVRRRHRRKLRKGNIYTENDYPKPSKSQYSPSGTEDYEDDEQRMSMEDGLYAESESVSIASSSQFSIPMPESVITRKSHTYHAPNSPSESQPISEIASYLNIAPLPIFNGKPEECPVTHLSRFAKVCRANNVASIEMMMKIFPVTLEKEAAIWYDLNIEPYPSLTWEEIKASFLDAYHKNELVEQFRSELTMINQGQEEPVRSYFLRLQWILNRWPEHGIPDTLLQGIFVDGLRQDFQEWIIPQKPNSLDEALGLAFTWEQLRNIRMARKKEVEHCGFCEGTHEEEDCEIRGKMRELWIKNKGKQSSVCSAKIETIGGTDKMLTRSVSDVVRRHEEEGEKQQEEEGVLGGRQRNQCQCWKHQCRLKKKLERNSSAVTGNSCNAG